MSQLDIDKAIVGCDDLREDALFSFHFGDPTGGDLIGLVPAEKCPLWVAEPERRKREAGMLTLDGSETDWQVCIIFSAVPTRRCKAVIEILLLCTLPPCK